METYKSTIKDKRKIGKIKENIKKEDVFYFVLKTNKFHKKSGFHFKVKQTSIYKSRCEKERNCNITQTC